MQQSIRISEASDVSPGTSASRSGGCCGGSCGCGSQGDSGAATAAGAQTFEVEGLTCDHCVRSVTEELSGLAGVETVSVDLVNGGRSQVSVAADAPLRSEDVRAAISEAGYTLVER